MTKFSTTAFLLAALAGCKEPGPVDHALSELAEYKDQMCECTERNCVFRVEAAHSTDPQGGPSWADRRENRVSKEGSPDEVKKLKAIKEQLSKCLADLSAREVKSGGW